MSVQKIGSVKIPPFDKDNYDMWKRKMLLFIKVAHPKYIRVLTTGPILHMVHVEEVVVNGQVTVPGEHYQKILIPLLLLKKRNLPLTIVCSLS